MKSTQVIYLIAIFTLIGHVARSQVEYGKVMISGKIAMNSISVTTPGIPNGYNNKVKTAGIAPIAGYFIFQNFSAGLELLYNYKKSLLADSFTTNTLRSLSFVPFMRYYFVNGKIRPYFQAGAGGGFGKSTNKKGNFSETTQKLLKIFTQKIFIASPQWGLPGIFGKDYLLISLWAMKLIAKVLFCMKIQNNSFHFLQVNRLQSTGRASEP